MEMFSSSSSRVEEGCLVLNLLDAVPFGCWCSGWFGLLSGCPDFVSCAIRRHKLAELNRASLPELCSKSEFTAQLSVKCQVFPGKPRGPSQRRSWELWSNNKQISKQALSSFELTVKNGRKSPNIWLTGEEGEKSAGVSCVLWSFPWKMVSTVPWSCFKGN